MFESCLRQITCKNQFVFRSTLRRMQQKGKTVTILKTVLWAFLLYAVYSGFIFLIQRHIMFPRSMIPGPSPVADKISGLEKIWLETSSGRTEAWYLPPIPSRNALGPAVMFAHGNGELIDFWPDEMIPFRKMGIGVLLVEYPGYGRSAGSPSQKSITEAFVKAYDWLKIRPEVDPGQIVFFGRSLGGGAVCALAQERSSAALILMSAFTNVRTFAKRFLAPPFLVRDPFDNLAVVSSYPNPLLVIHGKYDDVVPYRHGLALSRSAPNAKMISYDCAHNDCLPGFGTFWEDIEQFLQDSTIMKKS